MAANNPKEKIIIQPVIPSEIPMAENSTRARTVVSNNVPSNVSIAPDDDVQTLKVVFRGGCNTAIEPSMLKPGQFSMIQNMRNMHPGLKQRMGCVKLHTTSDGTNEVMSLFQLSKGKITERHFYAQMSDGDVLEATTAPPTVTSGVFGTEVFNGTSTDQIPASWSVINDTLVYSNGSDYHQIYGGNNKPVRRFIVYRGAAAIPNVPDIGGDYTSEVTDSDTTTFAILDSLSTLANFDCIFIKTHIRANAVAWVMSNYNSAASVMKANYWNGAWTDLSITDNTSVTGATLGQDSTMTWTMPTDEIPRYMFGEAGYWYQFYIYSGALDSEVEVNAVTYNSEWQNISDIWDSIPVDIVEAQFYVAADAAYHNTTPAITEYVDETKRYRTYSAASIDIGGMVAANDQLYFNAGIDNIEGFYVDVGATPNTTASTTINAVYYYSAETNTWVTVGTVTDGTNGMSQSGWVTFARKNASSRQFNKSKSYGKWYYFTVDKTLSANISISIQVMPYFSISEYGKGICNCAWKDRMAYVFSNDPESIVVSEVDNYMVLSGEGSDVKKAGDGRKNKIIAMKQFHNELMVWQEEKGVQGGCLTLIEGYSTSTFGQLVISSQVGCVNAKSVVVVDGILISTGTEERPQTMAYFISRNGVFVTDGQTATAISDDIRNYFDPTKSECIRRGYENYHWMVYDQSHHVLRLGLVSGGSATKANIFPVYDLIDKTWTFDSLGQPFSCMTQIEAATGNISVLQVGGGTNDGFIYRSNAETNNDVNTAIDSYATMEIDGHGDYINMREMTLRIKSGEGTCTITASNENGVQSTYTVP